MKEEEEEEEEDSTNYNVQAAPPVDFSGVKVSARWVSRGSKPLTSWRPREDSVWAMGELKREFGGTKTKSSVAADDDSLI